MTKDAKYYCDLIVDELKGDTEVGISLAMAEAAGKERERALEILTKAAIKDWPVGVALNYLREEFRKLARDNK